MLTQKTEDDYWREVIDPGDRASKLAAEICRGSYRNNDLIRIVPHQPGNFRGPVGFLWRSEILNAMADYSADENGNMSRWQLMQAVENDGAGGKPQFFTLLNDPASFGYLGWEIITMCADDFARSGRYGVLMANELNAKRITDKNFHLFEALMEGYGSALRNARLVNITGETAIMKHSVTAFCDTDNDEQLVLTWGGTCIGLCDRTKLIDGSGIKPHLPIVGFHEKGYRCNGGTLFTNVIMHRFGADRHRLVQEPEVRKLVSKLCQHSVSYSRLMAVLQGWESSDWVSPRVKILGAAHITGGGLWEKFQEMLPPGIGADLHSMPVPPEVLREGQELSLGTPFQLSDWQAYRTFHGGPGMLVVCTEESVGEIMATASSFDIEASIVGETISSPENEVFITSRFMNSGRRLSSKHPE